MKVTKLLLLLCLSQFIVFATNAQSLSLKSVWHDSSLPISDGVRYNEVWGYTDCQGDEYGIIGSLRKIHFIDLRDPSNPVEIADFAGGGASFWRDMKVYKNRAYAVTEDSSEGMMVFDLSGLPNEIIKSNQIREDFGSAHNIFVDTDNARLYVVGTNTRNNGVIIYDLSVDMDEPTVIANISLDGGYVHDMFVRDNIGYCSHGNNGLYIYDFTNAANPVLLGRINTYPEKGYNHSSWLSPDGNQLVFADETFDRGLKFLDVSDKTDLTVTDVFRSEMLAPSATGSIAHNPFIRDGLIFVSYYHEGVQVFDYSDPSNIQHVTGYDTEPNNVNYNGFTGCWGTYPFFNSGIILGSDMTHGLFVLEMNGYEFEPIDFGSAPSLTLSTSEREIALCNDETVNVSAVSDDASLTIEWHRNGVLVADGADYEINEPGLYQAVITQGSCTVRSEEIKVVTKPLNELSVSGRQSICIGTTIDFSFIGEADTYTFYDENDNIIQSGTNPSLVIDATGTYYGIVEKDACIARTEILEVEVLIPASEALITVQNGLLLASEGIAYQWYLDGMALEGENNRSLGIRTSGSYMVEITDVTTGCLVRSEAFLIKEGEIVENIELQQVSFHFAPDSKLLNAQFISNGTPLQLHLYDGLGRTIFQKSVKTNGFFSRSWDVSNLAAGVYYFGVTDSKETYYKKIYIQP